MTSLEQAIDSFEPISLKEMDRVVLQNRTDTKFVFAANLLPEILMNLTPFYLLLEINDKRVNHYKTLYYDTKELTSYHEHHNGKTNRVKVRYRNYIESGLNYLEVKLKNNKGRTIKSREKIEAIETSPSEHSISFIENNSTYHRDNLLPVLWNKFTRLTFVHKTKNERLTIDLELTFNSYNESEEIKVDHIVVAEVKQEKASQDSDFIKTIKKFGIRKSGMSKYCIGTVLTNNQVKSNNFKEKILNINKLKYA